ncbi:MAG TPA: hypothetical protein VMC81_05820 [Rhodocyclaceae bacterium]|nr:hypothetical protein [Rhodocyclaceae bacterium]
MKLFFAALAVIIAILFAPMVLSPAPDNSHGKPVEGLPWQIEALPDGTSRVLGLALGTATLNDARARFGDGELALVAAQDETESLEMYFTDVTAGVITGKVVVTGAMGAADLAALRQRATKTEYMASGTKKSQLADQDLPAAYATPVRALAFIPSVNLDEAMVIQRFGQPGERIRVSDKLEHFLYPERGLDVVLDADGKELLQYVAPRDFAKLREPLISEGATK